jgi:hypothetical protein
VSVRHEYVAKLNNVREVSLYGTADLAFWKDRLRPTGLYPTERAGGARLMIGAIESRFMGISFREATICVFVSRQEGGSDEDGVYLARAFNSSRFFAFVERTCFASPYLHGDLRVHARHPAAFEVSRDGEPALAVAMSASAPGRNPTPSEDRSWAGPVFLPNKRGKCGGLVKFFPALISGATQAFPFLPSVDRVTIRPSRDDAALRSLVESNFIGEEWYLREGATHAKGKTVEAGSAALAFAISGS